MLPLGPSRIPLPQPCYYCGSEGQKVCSICRAWYCSSDCQGWDWAKHSLSCKPPPALLDPFQSTKDLFNVNKNKDQERTRKALDYYGQSSDPIAHGGKTIEYFPGGKASNPCTNSAECYKQGGLIQNHKADNHLTCIKPVAFTMPDKLITSDDAISKTPDTVCEAIATVAIGSNKADQQINASEMMYDGKAVMFPNDIPQPRLEMGKRFIVDTSFINFVSPSEFSLRLDAGKENYHLIKEALSSKIDSPEGIKLKKNMSVLVNTPHGWQRAMAVKKQKSEISLYLLDLGIIHMADEATLLPLPDNAKEFPVCALQVSLYGVLSIDEEWSRDDCAFSEKFFAEDKFSLEVMGRHKTGRLSVKVYKPRESQLDCLNDLLILKGKRCKAIEMNLGPLDNGDPQEANFKSRESQVDVTSREIKPSTHQEQPRSCDQNPTAGGRNPQHNQRKKDEPVADLNASKPTVSCSQAEQRKERELSSISAAAIPKREEVRMDGPAPTTTNNFQQDGKKLPEDNSKLTGSQIVERPQCSKQHVATSVSSQSSGISYLERTRPQARIEGPSVWHNKGARPKERVAPGNVSDLKYEKKKGHESNSDCSTSTSTSQLEPKSQCPSKQKTETNVKISRMEGNPNAQQQTRSEVKDPIVGGLVGKTFRAFISRFASLTHFFLTLSSDDLDGSGDSTRIIHATLDRVDPSTLSPDIEMQKEILGIADKLVYHVTVIRVEGDLHHVEMRDSSNNDLLNLLTELSICHPIMGKPKPADESKGCSPTNNSESMGCPPTVGSSFKGSLYLFSSLTDFHIRPMTGVDRPSHERGIRAALANVDMSYVSADISLLKEVLGIESNVMYDATVTKVENGIAHVQLKDPHGHDLLSLLVELGLCETYKQAKKQNTDDGALTEKSAKETGEDAVKQLAVNVSFKATIIALKSLTDFCIQPISAVDRQLFGCSSQGIRVGLLRVEDVHVYADRNFLEQVLGVGTKLIYDVTVVKVDGDKILVQMKDPDSIDLYDLLAELGLCQQAGKDEKGTDVSAMDGKEATKLSEERIECENMVGRSFKGTIAKFQSLVEFYVTSIDGDQNVMKPGGESGLRAALAKVNASTISSDKETIMQVLGVEEKLVFTITIVDVKDDVHVVQMKDPDGSDMLELLLDLDLCQQEKNGGE